MIAGMNELSDVQLEYLDEEQLGLQPADVPASGRWPHIRPPRWPFSGGLVSTESSFSWLCISYFCIQRVVVQAPLPLCVAHEANNSSLPAI